MNVLFGHSEGLGITLQCFLLVVFLQYSVLSLLSLHLPNEVTYSMLKSSDIIGGNNFKA